jgi:hypothetical protein
MIEYGRNICTTIEENGISIDHPERCTILFVLIAVRMLRFRLNLMGIDRFIAVTVIKNIDQNDFNVWNNCKLLATN